ncbi:MAG: HAMP domain-containing protein [Alphaproteobacteria bacterium]|nr:HAMP domain-containing protein [Alphaproteobacteria bacterium]
MSSDRIEPAPSALVGWIKRYLPRGLLGRTLAILITPVVLMQAVAAYVFFESPWEAGTRRLALGLAGEIASLIEILDHFPAEEDRQRIVDLAARRLQLDLRVSSGERLPRGGVEPRGLVMRNVAEALAEIFDRPFLLNSERLGERFEILVELDGAVLHVLAPRKRVAFPNSATFLLWLFGSAVIFVVVGVLFMRNQVRPIRRLAEAADAFGRGQEAGDFRPQGASEVRQAAAAFLTMRQRLRRQMRQRTEMLAGVSHDLRTPLTRMRLALALQKATPETRDLKADIDEMEKMIGAYLAFAKGADGEVAAPTDLGLLLGDIVDQAKRQGATVELALSGDLALPVRPVALRRCLVNLIENARRHAKRIAIAARRLPGQIEITIDDDGPGIPQDKREIVFRAFHRLDASRNPDKGGAGLGLSIARDVARSHGGNVLLADSPLGGLRALVSLPA